MRPLSVGDAWEIQLVPHSDNRGTFVEWFKSEHLFETLGHTLPLAQANCSVSRKGVIRGIHFVDVPPGQAKYVTCAAGEVLDVVVDVRVGSPTFGQWDAICLGGGSWNAVYMAEGLGHAFMALSDQATVMYLCSSPYAAERERAVHPLDPDLALPWPREVDWVVSTKDTTAPSLKEARDQALLPLYELCAPRATG